MPVGQYNTTDILKTNSMEPFLRNEVKKFTAFYGTQRLTTIFTRALHWFQV